MNNEVEKIDHEANVVIVQSIERYMHQLLDGKISKETVNKELLSAHKHAWTIAIDLQKGLKQLGWRPPVEVPQCFYEGSCVLKEDGKCTAERKCKYKEKQGTGKVPKDILSYRGKLWETHWFKLPPQDRVEAVRDKIAKRLAYQTLDGFGNEEETWEWVKKEGSEHEYYNKANQICQLFSDNTPKKEE